MASRQNGVVRALRGFVDTIWGDPTLQRARRLERRSIAASRAHRMPEALALQKDAVILFERVGSVMPRHRGEVASAQAWLGKCLTAMNQHAEAIDPLRKSADAFRRFTAKHRGFAYHLLDALHVLGAAQHHLERNEEALASLTEAAALGRDIEGTFDDWRRRMGGILQYLGFTQAALGQARAAHASMLEALGHFRQLARDGAPGSTELLAQAFASLSRKEIGLGAMQAALESAEVAVQLFRSFDAAPSDGISRALADALASLGAAQAAVGRDAQAIESNTQAVALLREIGAAEPRYLTYVSYVLGNLANARSDLGAYDLALESARESVAACRKVVNEGLDPNAERARDWLAVSLGHLAFFLRALDFNGPALDATREASELLGTGEPKSDDSRRARASVLSSLAMTLARVGRLDEGYRAAREALALGRWLAAANPRLGLPDLASLLAAQSGVESALGLRREAAASAAECVELARRLAVEQPERRADRLAAYLNRLSACQCELGLRSEALASAEEAVATWRKLANRNPDGAAIWLGSGLLMLADAQGDLNRHEEARAGVSEAIAIFRRLAVVHPRMGTPSLIASLRRLARAEREAGRAKEALAAASEAVTLLRGLLPENPGRYRIYLAKGLAEVARTRLAAKEADADLAVAEAIALCRQLVVENRNGTIADLAGSLQVAAAIHGGGGRRAQARAAATEAVALYEELAAAYPEVFADKLAAARERLALS